ncbi:MAG: AMP-binding protein [Jatrophihabitantaceae bacterium]
MPRQVINELLSRPPRPGNRISFVRLDGTRSIELTELYEQSGRLAMQLAEAGLRAGDRIGILAANCLEWVLLDLAALRLKVMVAGFEPGKFTADRALVKRYRLAALFTDRSVPEADEAIRPISDVLDLCENGGCANPPVLRYQPAEAYALKFTSGSSGEPKGLTASVGSIDNTMSAVQDMFQHGSQDDLFLFLPLSLLQQRFWIYSALSFGHDVTVSTYEAAFPALRKACPTVVMGVPGFFETAMKHLTTRACRAADVPFPEAVRQAAVDFFGDRVRYLWTGSAPARQEMLRFFIDAGLPIFEGYGLNEACIVAKNSPTAHRLGSVGKVLPGKTVLFDDNGVISVRCDYPVCSGYLYGAPEDSARIFAGDGVIRTGDLGYLDEDGFLYIQGRADDVIVLDNGRKVIVRPIEERIQASPAIDACVLFCPTQTSLVAVISPATEPADKDAILAHVAACNAVLAADEQAARVVIAEPRFSTDNGLLSGQFKPRRARILQRYRAEIHAQPQGSEAIG